MSIQQTIDAMLASRTHFEGILAKGTKLRTPTPSERILLPTLTGFVECDLNDVERAELQDAIDKLNIAIRERQSALRLSDSNSSPEST